VNKTRKRGPRVRGIVQAAEDLGVTRQHLRHVLAGRRRSRRLMARYDRWQRIQKEGGLRE